MLGRQSGDVGLNARYVSSWASIAGNQAEMNRVFLLRNFLADMPEAEAVEFLLRQMKKSKNNAEFFQQMAQG